jgi:flagellar hook protein FlgE
MSILTSLYIGANGMTAHGSAISVVGDNIANTSTVGFKRARAGFADILGGSLNGRHLGGGVRHALNQTDYGQGALQQTGGPLDLAISGDGFFVVRGDHGGQVGQYYTRDGRFGLDNEGFVVDPRGLRLQGFNMTATVQAAGPGDLQLGGRQSPPEATTIANLSLNLDSSAVPPAAWDPTNPSTTSNYATSMTVYDSLGAAHRVEVYFRAQGGGAWEWHAMVDGGDLTGGTAGTPTEIANGALTFDPNGALDTETVNASSADFVGAAPGQAIQLDFGDAITTDGGTGRAGTTQYAGASSVTSIDTDGHSLGNLIDLQVAEDGTIEGVFDNGDRQALARVAIATFASEAGLDRAGDGLVAQTAASGQALIDAAGEGGRGAIASGALEASNVDLGEELVTLIAYQRAFQANARTVTTADEMMAEIANLKR